MALEHCDLSHGNRYSARGYRTLISSSASHSHIVAGFADVETVHRTVSFGYSRRCNHYAGVDAAPRRGNNRSTFVSACSGLKILRLRYHPPARSVSFVKEIRYCLFPVSPTVFHAPLPDLPLAISAATLIIPMPSREKECEVLGPSVK